MYGNKPWHQSTGIWGSLVVLVLGVPMAFLGMHLSNEEIAFILRQASLMLTGMGGLMAFLGRKYAKQGIGKPLETALASTEGLSASPLFDLDGKFAELTNQLKAALPSVATPSSDQTDSNSKLRPPAAWPDPPAENPDAPSSAPADPAPVSSPASDAPVLDPISSFLKSPDALQTFMAFVKQVQAMESALGASSPTDSASTTPPAVDGAQPQTQAPQEGAQ
jgi:hypothetical protein